MMEPLPTWLQMVIRFTYTPEPQLKFSSKFVLGSQSLNALHHQPFILLSLLFLRVKQQSLSAVCLSAEQVSLSCFCTVPLVSHNNSKQRQIQKTHRIILASQFFNFLISQVNKSLFGNARIIDFSTKSCKNDFLAKMNSGQESRVVWQPNSQVNSF